MSLSLRLVSHRLISALALVPGLLLVAASAASAQTTALYLESQPGDPVGGGKTFAFDTTGFTFFENGDSGPDHAHISLAPLGEGPYNVGVGLLASPSLVPGHYEVLPGLGLKPVSLSVTTPVGWCSSGPALFDVLELERRPDGSLLRFAVDFELHCDDNDAGLFGALRFNSSLPLGSPFGGQYPTYRLTVAPAEHGRITGGGIECGSGAAACTTTVSSPTTLTVTAAAEPGFQFVRWSGQCGGSGPVATVRVNMAKSCSAVFEADPGGTTALFFDRTAAASAPALQVDYSTADSSFAFTATNDRQLTLSVARFDGTSTASISIVSGYLALANGTFPNALPAPPPGGNGLVVSGDAACSVASGRFAVREILFTTDGRVQRLAVDIEVACSEGSILYGGVRFHSTISDTRPFGGTYPDRRLEVTPALHGRVTGDGIDCGAGAAACTVRPGVAGPLTLVALPEPGYLFAGWIGDCTGRTTATQVLVDGIRECRAEFAASSSGADPRSILYLDTWSAVGARATDVFVPATAYWLVDAGNGGRWARFRITAAGGLTTLTLGSYQSPSPLSPGEYSTGYPVPGFNGLSLVRGGTACTGPGSVTIHEVTIGSDDRVVTLAADFDVACGESNTRVYGAIRYQSSVSDTLPFAGNYPAYELRLTPPSGGRIVAGGAVCSVGLSLCASSYSQPSTVGLIAEPDAGNIFAGWTGDCSGGATTNIEVDRVVRCGVRFESATAAHTLATWSVFAHGSDVPLEAQTLALSNSAWQTFVNGDTHAVSLVLQSPSDMWTLTAGAPGGQPLEAGDYPAARASVDTVGPFLAFSRVWTTCHDLTGTYVVLEAAYGDDGSVTRLALDFEEHCDTTGTVTYGAIRFNSTIAEVRPFGGRYPLAELTIGLPEYGRITGPGIDCGGTGLACTSTYGAPLDVPLRATPVPGAYFIGWAGDCHGIDVTSVRVDGRKTCRAEFGPLLSPDPKTLLVWRSEPNDPVGQGAQERYFEGNSRWSTFGSKPNELRLTVQPAASTPIVMRFSSGTPASLAPGVYTTSVDNWRMAISQEGSCGIWGTGTFRIRELAFDQSGELQALALDFVQACTSDAPALRGAIRYRSSVPVRDLDRDQRSLHFVALVDSAGNVTEPGAQTLRLVRSEGGTVSWTAASTQPWLSVSPSSGTGAAALTVRATVPPGVGPGVSLAGQIVVNVTGAIVDVLRTDVSLSTIQSSDDAPPIGLFETPIEGPLTWHGAIPFTGWALDDVGVADVVICREPTAFETAGPDGRCGGHAQVYVGSAVSIEGARPDVAQAYPGHPRANEAGWGFMVLTNMLPGQGNGGYVFSVYAHDGSGHVSLLGTRALQIDNQDALPPFGTIDTPAQGETISGTAYINFGWALATTGRAVPVDGSTLTVFVDGAQLGHPSYNHYRQDIATAFPGLANSDGAVGYWVLDTTTLTDGLHTIVWTVTDTDGHTEGLGSRFFRVANGSTAAAGASELHSELALRMSGAPPEPEANVASSAWLAELPIDRTAMDWQRGWGTNASVHRANPDAAGLIVIRGEEVDRFELTLGGVGEWNGSRRTGTGLTVLPPGSHLDTATGVFAWAPGPGFVGSYELVFVRSESGVPVARRDVRVVIAPKGSLRTGPQVVIDTPRQQQDVPQPFMLAGWAADLDAVADTGIDTVHAWAYPLAGGSPIFLGMADYGGARPDVAAAYGDQFERSGFGIPVQGLTPGNYDLAVFAWSHVTGGFVPATVVRLTVR